MNKSLSILNTKRAATVAMLIAAVLYSLTMNRTYGFIDQGELAAVASTLGVAHPTGYPLLMIFGFLWTKILPIESILALNILSLLLCSFSVYLLTSLFDFLLANFAHDNFSFKSKKNVKPDRDKLKNKNVKQAKEKQNSVEIIHHLTNESRAFISGIAALVLGTSSLWWSQSNGFEVYSLHLFFMPLVTLLYLKYLFIEKAEPDAKTGFSYYGNLFALCLGLSFSNHLMTILFAPAFLFLFFYKNGFKANAFKKILFLIPGFLTGVLPYVILPLIASNKPFLNWGGVNNFESFFRHISAFQYRVWMFNSIEAFKQNSIAFLRILPTELAIMGIILAVIGFVFWFKKNRIMALFVLILLLTNVVYSGGYDIPDILNYYTGSLFALSILIVGGLVALHDLINSNIFMFAAPVLILINVFFNFSKVNENGNSLVKDYTVNVLTSLPPKSIIISAQWDFFVAGSFYEQTTNKLRSDVVVIDPELVRRSWYIRQLDCNYPFLMKDLQTEKDKFLEQLNLFENNLAYDPKVIQSTFIGLIDGIIDKNKSNYNIFFSGISDTDYGKKYSRVPYQLGYKLVENNLNYVPQKFIDYKYNKFINSTSGIKSWFEPKQSPYTAKINEFYTRYIFERMNYELRSGKREEGKKYRDLLDKFLIEITDEDLENCPPKNRDIYQESKNFFEEIKNILPKIDV